MQAVVFGCWFGTSGRRRGTSEKVCAGLLNGDRATIERMKTEGLPRRLARWLISHPKTVAALLAAHLVFIAATLPFLRVVSGTAPFFSPDEPVSRQIERVEQHFVGENVLVVAVESGDVFSHRGLSEIRALTQASQRLTDTRGKPLVEEVTSITTVKDLVGSELSFSTVPLVPDPLPSDAAALGGIRQRALKNRLVRDHLLSPERADVSALIVRLVRSLDDDGRAEAVAGLRRLFEDRASSGGARARLTGIPAIDTDTARYMKSDLGFFIPVIYLLVTALLYAFSRRIAAVLLTLVNLTWCLCVGMGILHVTGGSVNNLSTILPPVMMVLSVATMVHFLSELSKTLRDLGGGEDRAHAALEQTLGELLVPVFMTEVTTAVGFGALASANVPALREFGLAAALAVMAMMWISVLWAALAGRVLPMRWLLSPKSAALSPFYDRGLRRVADFVVDRPRAALALSLALVGGATAGALQVVSDENAIEHFGRELPLRTDTEFVERVLGGSTQVVVSIRAVKAGAFREPENLAQLQRVEEALRRTGADRVTSPTDFLRLMHRAFFSEDDAYDRLPETAEQVAQLLLLNGDDTLREYLDGEQQWVRVVARYREHSSAAMGKVYQQLDAELARLFPGEAGFEALATGQSRLWVTMVDTNIGTQTRSFAVSFLLIFGPIALAFRSVRAALFAVPSNLFPVVLTYGVMGWWGMSLNMATAMTSSVVLGIAVDDTIHFIEYARARLRVHGDIDRAVRETFDTKGVGVLWITLIISLGFFVTVASNFRPTHHFGVLTGLAMFSGLIGELLVLPPLLVLTKTTLGLSRSELPSPGTPRAASDGPSVR
jgi:predicted RND superfamily exporter protein